MEHVVGSTNLSNNFSSMITLRNGLPTMGISLMFSQVV